jgi:hypothetical protein
VSETVRVRDEDYERLQAAQDVLGLPFPDVVHLALNTDILQDSPAQNARRAIQLYYTFVVERYDAVHEVPVEEIEMDSVDQVKAGLTIGAEKQARRRANDQ